MYLQSLELQGFKSFPDRVKLNFDRGITGVVGPNGSGKSNIGDAVRWVLGEQSTKTLRGNKMEDVIFSGTKKRKPTGFAAVTLEINNADGALGKENGEVVSITRRLYRSGDSEYRINGKNVRLKDITEMLMDTGMGRDGYAIIGQGRIAEIVSAKSTDRRDIFEEAAGVSKFRYKKEEAERRLEHAQDNLLRLTDIVGELESRVEPLRVQAEKAKEYVTLSESQKDLEVSLWMNRLQALRKKLRELNDELLQAKARLENAQRDSVSAEKQVQDGYKSMQESTQKMEELRMDLERIEEETAQLRSETAVAENELVHQEEAVKNLEHRRTETEAEMRKLKDQAVSRQNLRLSLIEQKQALTKQQAETDAESERITRQFQEFGADYEKIGKQRQALLVQQSEIRVRLQTIAQNTEETRAKIAEYKMQLVARGDDQSRAVQQAEQDKKSAAEKQQTLVELQNMRDGFQRKYANSVKQLEEGKRRQEQTGFDLRAKRQRSQLLQDMERNMEGFTGSVKSVLRADGGHPHGVLGTVAQLIRTDSRYGVAIETALGAAMQNLVVTDENAAKQWIRYLQKNHAGRATFLPLTSIHGRYLQENGLERMPGFINIACNLVKYEPQFQEIAANLLGRIVVAEDLDSATEIAKAYRYRFRIVTLDGQVINAGGSFTGGSAQRSGGMLTRRAELEQLEKELLELTQKNQEATAALQEAQNKSRQLEQEMNRLHLNCRNAESEQLAAAAQAEKSLYLMQQAQQRMQEAEQQEKDLQQRMQENVLEQEQLQNQLQETESALENMQEQLVASEGKREDLQKEQTRLSEKQTELKIQAAALEKDLENAKMILDEHTAAQAQYVETLRALQEQKKNLEQEKEAKQKEIVSAKEQIELLSKEKMEKQAQRAHYSNLHNNQEQQIRQLQSGLRETNVAQEKFDGECRRIEEKCNATRTDYDGVIHQLFEKYELSVSEAQAQAKPIEDFQKAQQDLMAIKGKIRALGSVNVASIQEYEEVSTRYRFLSTQMKDAQTAKAELEDLIVSLTQDMQHIFAESFQEINKNFQTIFRDLFGGGEAKLELTEPDNVLESGIEIKVAPPGKVIKNLISLSGGEQSFVAIAIYFSILRLRPAPFCILDEIDAALDEGNVRRYAQYLQNFTDTTQFILVTHRRSAMEEAAVLYGVTMQEDGVSRLLRMEQEEFAELEN